MGISSRETSEALEELILDYKQIKENETDNK